MGTGEGRPPAPVPVFHFPTMINNRLANRKESRQQNKTSLQVQMACGILLMSVGLQSCEKDILTGQPEWLGNSIYERLEEGIEVNGQVQSFDITLNLINDLGQKDVLSKTGSKTLFVTTDSAYAEWFRTNDWGVRNYEDLSTSQKKLLLNNSMINNAYLLELMSNVSGNPPQEGLCMRRPTASSIYDSIPVMTVSEMPVDPLLKTRLDSWASLREAGKDIRILKNDDAAPMIHFLPEFMSKNKITDSDLEILTNGNSKSIADSWINGKKVISTDQTCKNGYIYVVDGVIESNKNMAEIISSEPQMSRWASMLNRFSTPVPATGSTLANFQRLYNTSDTCYVLRYFSKASQGAAALSKTPQGYSVPATLTFDPGMNQYMWANTMGYDMHYDAGAMIVPTDEALATWWDNAGKGLQQEYGTWENVPALTISKLLNVNMLSSFVDAVPSKFGSIVDDSKVELGIEPEDVVKCYMGCNGVVYLVNKVFGPSEYSSVVYPALAHQSIMGVIYYAIDNYDFGPFLNSMESEFSLILPYNVTQSYDGEHEVLLYLDPSSYGLSTQVMYEFYFDDESQMPKCDRYQVTIDSLTHELTYLNKLPEPSADASSTSGVINNRLSDLIDNSIIVGLLKPGQEYYKTKAGSVIRAVTSDPRQSVTFQGGYQMETGESIVVDRTNIYDLTKETNGKGNGISYGVGDSIGRSLCIPFTASKSVYQILKEAASDDASTSKLFFKLLSEDPTTDALLASETGSGTKYYCANDQSNKNIRLFDNYNYTVYVPADSSIQNMIDMGYLPTWDDYEAYSDAVDSGDKNAVAAQDSIADIIHSFLRYHFQDNAVYIGGESVTGAKYESSKLNTRNNRFFSIEVTASNDGMTVKDAWTISQENVGKTGVTRKVITDNGFYNKTSREYWFTTKATTAVVAANRKIYSSSNAVVHQIDGVLLYDRDAQFTSWKSHLPETK